MNRISKLGIIALACAGLLSVSTSMAEAKGFSAGHFRLVEAPGLSLTFCLRSNGTFVQTGGGGITGRWANRTLNGTTTGFLWGNTLNGLLNLSVISLGVANSKVTQWTDTNIIPPTIFNAVRITKTSNTCPV